MDNVSPELPFLAAGAVAIVGGYRREGAFPRDGIKAAAATAVLVIVAAAASGTRFAPLMQALGLSLFVAAVLSTTRVFTDKTKD